MPTAAAFEAAARTLDDVADEFSSLLTTTPGWFGPDTLLGGLLSMVTDLTISTTTKTADDVAARLRATADTCRYRAAVCRAYADDLTEFRLAQRRHDAEPATSMMVPPLRPTRPATWVDV